VATWWGWGHGNQLELCIDAPKYPISCWALNGLWAPYPLLWVLLWDQRTDPFHTLYNQDSPHLSSLALHIYFTPTHCPTWTVADASMNLYSTYSAVLSQTSSEVVPQLQELETSKKAFEWKTMLQVLLVSKRQRSHSKCEIFCMASHFQGRWQWLLMCKTRSVSQKRKPSVTTHDLRFYFKATPNPWSSRTGREKKRCGGWRHLTYLHCMWKPVMSTSPALVLGCSTVRASDRPKWTNIHSYVCTASRVAAKAC